MSLVLNPSQIAIRKLLALPLGHSRLPQLAHEILLNPEASLAQKKIAMRRINEVLGKANPDKGLEASIVEYIQTFS